MQLFSFLRNIMIILQTKRKEDFFSIILALISLTILTNCKLFSSFPTTSYSSPLVTYLRKLGSCDHFSGTSSFSTLRFSAGAASPKNNHRIDWNIFFSLELSKSTTRLFYFVTILQRLQIDTSNRSSFLEIL